MPDFRNFFFILAVLTLLSSCKAGVGHQKLKEAEELSRQGKYSESIDAYMQHMRYRLSLKDRPKWENPYFYYLLVGDVYLGQGKVEEALEAYAKARSEGIHKTLISDRYRMVAQWYEDHEQYEKAIELLKANRELDDMLFDAMLDRVSKQMLAAEQK